jgi:hypothetical protein
MMMAKTVTPRTTLEALDDDLRAAIAYRDETWLILVRKDTPANAKAFDDAMAAVDSLLEMRHGLSG